MITCFQGSTCLLHRKGRKSKPTQIWHKCHKIPHPDPHFHLILFQDYTHKHWSFKMIHINTKGPHVNSGANMNVPSIFYVVLHHLIVIVRAVTKVYGIKGYFFWDNSLWLGPISTVFKIRYIVDLIMVHCGKEKGAKFCPSHNALNFSIPPRPQLLTLKINNI